MIIDRLILKNFKRFRDQEIRFKDGITGILGNNGTGKSSIVQAIFFALYGVKSTEIEPDYIVSSFASPKERCEVRLDFRIGRDNYSVFRKFKKGKKVDHDVTFHKDGKLMATGVNQVETELRRTLGMGPVDFRNTIYAAQKDLLTLLEADPSERKKWFRKALGIDYLNTESKNILKERIGEKERELQLSEGELKGLREHLNVEEFATLQVSVAEFKHTIRTLKKQREDLLEKKKVIDKEFRQFSDKKTEYTRLIERQVSLTKETGSLVKQQNHGKTKLVDLVRWEQEYCELEQRVSVYPERKQVLEVLRRRKSELDQIQAEVRFTERDCSDLKNRMNKSQAKITDLEKDAVRKVSLITGIRQRLSLGLEISDRDLENVIMTREAETLNAIGTLSARQDRLAIERTKLLSDKKTIQNAGPEGVCPLCHQTLGSHYISIEKEFDARILSIKDEEVQLLREQERLSAEKDRISLEKPNLFEIRTLSEKLKMRKSFEAERSDLLSQLHEKELSHQSLTQKIKELKFDEGVFSQTGKEVDELEKIQSRFIDLGKKIAQATVFKKQVSDLEEQITQKQAENANLTSEIERLSFDSEEGSAIEKARTELDTTIQFTDTEIARITERLIHIEEKIGTYKRGEIQIAELEQRIIAFKEEIDLLNLTQSVIAEYVIYLMQVVKSQIEGEVSRIVNEITDGRYERVLLDENFNLLVRDIDNDYLIERFSGGERDDIAVALRISLSRYLAELHQVHESTFLIFDEIFGSQDEERRNNLLTALRTQESRFPQIILISHISEMQGDFTNTLLVEMGSDQVSRVREVEE